MTPCILAKICEGVKPPKRHHEDGISSSGNFFQDPALVENISPGPGHSDTCGQHLSLSEALDPIPYYWPAEIIDSMTWSSQFIDITQGSQMGGEYKE